VTIRLGTALRWVLLVPALLAISGAWFAVRWYVGNTIAEYSPAVAEDRIEMARVAVRWAPGDPLVHWRLGSLQEKTFSAENMAAAVSEYRMAVTLSPNDYRYWMELGHALEANGDPDSGEKALRRSVELAPAYSHPRWYFGNLLIREGKYDEGFEQLGHAAEADALMRPQVFDLAMRLLGGDINQIAKIVGVSPAARLQFSIYLVTAKRFDEAMRMWNTLSAADRRATPDVVKEFEEALIQAKQFRSVLNVMRQIEPEAKIPQPGQFWNAGFETDLKTGVNPFNWVIESHGAAQAGVDTHAHTGQKSLRILFRAPRNLDKIAVSQMVVVEPDTQYRFECYMKTEDVISASTPVLYVRDAIAGVTLGSSNPIPSGTSDWQRVSFDFTTKPEHDGIIFGFYRPPCSDTGQICPIYGTVWYDDFNLQRIGPVNPRRDTGSPRH
jgi:tetratricopeptide (TPR) repeat protein